MKPTAKIKVAGSVGVSPKSKVSRYRVNANAPRMPTPIPIVINTRRGLMLPRGADHGRFPQVWPLFSGLTACGQQCIELSCKSIQGGFGGNAS